MTRLQNPEMAERLAAQKREARRAGAMLRDAMQHAPELHTVNQPRKLHAHKAFRGNHGAPLTILHVTKR